MRRMKYFYDYKYELNSLNRHPVFISSCSRVRIRVRKSPCSTNMNALLVLALLVVGTQAGYLHQPALYAAAPVAVATPVLTHTYPTYAVNSPVAHHVGSSYAAPAVYAAAAPAVYAAPLVKTLYSAPVYAGAYAHHYAAPSYGHAHKK